MKIEKLNLHNITPGKEDDIDVAHAMALAENDVRDRYIKTFENKGLIREMIVKSLEDQGIVSTDEEIEQDLNEYYEELKRSVENRGPILIELARRDHLGEFKGDEYDAPASTASEVLRQSEEEIREYNPDGAEAILEQSRANFGPGGTYSEMIQDEATKFYEKGQEKKNAA